jgi:hypothetical protein
MKMRNIILMLSATVLLLASCQKWISPDINVDPDNPTDASLDLLLPGIEGQIGYYIGGFDVAATPNIWTQQILGQDRQASAINGYIYRESDPNNLWGSMYAGVMMDLKNFITKAEDPNAPSRNVAGVGKVLMALCLGTMTDLFGDIPYSEAFQGQDNLQPAYDSQEAIYNEIMRLLGEAINDLGSTDPFENIYAIQNDFIYDGNTDLWIKAAHTLRARYNMHLVKVKSVNFNDVIADLDAGLSDISEDMQQPFDASPSAQNPMYQYVTQRSGYITDNATYVGMMMDDTLSYGVADPRAGVNEVSGSGFWSSKASPVALAQYTEALFLKAQAYVHKGMYNDARNTLKAAVASSMAKYGVNDAGWTTAFETDVDNTADGDLMQLIVEQKYLHMFMQLEAFTDYRLYGFPVLTPTVGSQVPRRYPYPTDENLYNNVNYKSVSVFDRVWWDQ